MRAPHEWRLLVSKPQRYRSLDRAVESSVAENAYTGFAVDVRRGPVIRGAVGDERSAVRADAAGPQVSRTTPQRAAYWAAAFNARHHKNRRGRMQTSAPDSLAQERTAQLKQPRKTSQNLRRCDRLATEP